MDKGEGKDVEQGQEKGLEREGEQRQESQDNVASPKEPEVGGDPRLELELEGEQCQEPQDNVASQKESEVGGEPGMEVEREEEQRASQKEPEVDGEPSREPEMVGEQRKEPENEMVSPQGLEESGEPSRDPDNDKSMRIDDSESDGTIHGEATASGQSALSLCRYDSSDHEMGKSWVVRLSHMIMTDEFFRLSSSSSEPKFS